MIKISIKYKVLIVLLLLSFVLVISMALNILVGFNRGFSKYRLAIENQFQQNMVKNLTKYYEKHKSWKLLKIDKIQWYELMSESSIEFGSANIKRLHSRRPKLFESHAPNKGDLKRFVMPPIMSLFDNEKVNILGRENNKNSELIGSSPLR